MKLKIVAVILVLAVFSNAWAAEVERKEYCSKSNKAKCVISEKTYGEVSLFFSSDSEYEITVTLETDLINATADRPLPYTNVITGPGKQKLLTIKRTNHTQAWRYSFKYRWLYGTPYAAHDDDYVYALPYAHGASYPVIQGYYGDFSHSPPGQYAVDFGMPENTAVCAARAGVVIDIKSDSTIGGDDQKYKNDGNYVYIMHPDKTIARYYHFRARGVTVRSGQSVRQGSIIGYSGSTGYSRGPHLHFEVYRPIDGKEAQTIPVNFMTVDGIISELEKGESYQAFYSD